MVKKKKNGRNSAVFHERSIPVVAVGGNIHMTPAGTLKRNGHGDSVAAAAAVAAGDGAVVVGDGGGCVRVDSYAGDGEVLVEAWG